MSGIDYTKIRSLIGIKKVLELIGYRAASTGGDQLRGPCPICMAASSSKNGRCFSVNLRKNAFRCFRCGAQGNQLEMWAAVNKLPLFEAAQDLCRRAGIEVPLIRRW